MSAQFPEEPSRCQCQSAHPQEKWECLEQDDGGNENQRVEPDEHENELFASDEFRMYCMKILPCTKRCRHDWTHCYYAHPGEKARRRDPRAFNYSGVACPDNTRDSACSRGNLCPYAHNVFEYWLHPSRYRTQLCNDGPRCARRVCFFAHTREELRLPAEKPCVLPEDVAKATAATDRGDSRKMSSHNLFDSASSIDKASSAFGLSRRAARTPSGRETASSERLNAAHSPDGQDQKEADAQLMQLLRQVLENQLRAGAPMDNNYVPSYASSMSEETKQSLIRSLSDPPAHQTRKQRHFEQAPVSDLLNTSQGLMREWASEEYEDVMAPSTLAPAEPAGAGVLTGCSASAGGLVQQRSASPKALAQEMPRNFAAAQALKRLQGVDEYPGTHSSGAPSRRHGRRPRGGQAPGMRGFPEGGSAGIRAFIREGSSLGATGGGPAGGAYARGDTVVDYSLRRASDESSRASLESEYRRASLESTARRVSLGSEARRSSIESAITDRTSFESRHEFAGNGLPGPAGLFEPLPPFGSPNPSLDPVPGLALGLSHDLSRGLSQDLSSDLAPVSSRLASQGSQLLQQQQVFQQQQAQQQQYLTSGYGMGGRDFSAQQQGLRQGPPPENWLESLQELGPSPDFNQGFGQSFGQGFGQSFSQDPVQETGQGPVQGFGQGPIQGPEENELLNAFLRRRHEMESDPSY